jgi:hypothetical protein
MWLIQTNKQVEWKWKDSIESCSLEMWMARDHEVKAKEKVQMTSLKVGQKVGILGEWLRKVRIDGWKSESWFNQIEGDWSTHSPLSVSWKGPDFLAFITHVSTKCEWNFNSTDTRWGSSVHMSLLSVMNTLEMDQWFETNELERDHKQGVGNDDHGLDPRNSRER